MFWCQPSLELQDPREIADQRREERWRSRGRLRNHSLGMWTHNLAPFRQERDQTEGLCPVPYYLYLVKYKNGLSRFNHKLQSGPKTFPNQGIIKRAPITLVWDVICQTEGSQPHCVNNNELISLERIKYWSTCYLLTPFNSLLSNSIGSKYFNLCMKGLLNSTGSVQEYSQTTQCSSMQNYPLHLLRRSARQQKLCSCASRHLTHLISPGEKQHLLIQAKQPWTLAVTAGMHSQRFQMFFNCSTSSHIP